MFERRKDAAQRGKVLRGFSKTPALGHLSLVRQMHLCHHLMRCGNLLDVGRCAEATRVCALGEIGSDLRQIQSQLKSLNSEFNFDRQRPVRHHIANSAAATA